ncbi:HDOD domain-containing protein [Desulfurivibrio alkaliphilus]|uniref:Metal dependent phosphohydrolase n=1 Tax=Desulfurivibrio alkaliphilus (strain DSM 19089 / UNIQEM U267 / AHT2) TaxID=589865 RepID=D6Z4A0_DESAT|nr:HDOD domain-containing protein [Desulfurivibrio alkaliphilus]ADH86375.1 metal dependent phosphohydrolase [Desulfurivibrio alkaliphilus AHT 2]
MSRVEEIVNLIEFVQPFPKVARRVMELLTDPEVEAKTLAEVIQYDQVITANVLKICNSPYYGLARKVSSLNEALVMIGHEPLKEIIVASSSAAYFKGEVGAGYALEQGELWRHSVAVGVLAKHLVGKIKEVEPGTAFTAGLLHDIGKRFLSSFVSDDFELIMAKVTQEKASFVEAEKDILGITHAELGGMILKRWDFPDEMQRAVQLHHDPEALAGEPLTALVALSNALVISAGIGVGADGLATRLKGEGLRRFGISQPHLDLAMVSLLEELEQAEELLRL